MADPKFINDALTSLIKLANTNKLKDAEQALRAFQQRVPTLPLDLQDYAQGMVHHLDSLLKQLVAKQKLEAEFLQEMVEIQEAVSRMVALREKYQLAEHQIQLGMKEKEALAKMKKEDLFLRRQILLNKKPLSAQNIRQLNEKFAKGLDNVYGVKDLPELKKPKNSFVQKIFTGVAGLFKSLSNSTNQKQQEAAVTQFSGDMIELFVGFLGMLFKPYLGENIKDADISAFGKNARTAFEKMNDPLIFGGPKAGQAPKAAAKNAPLPKPELKRARSNPLPF